MTKETYQEKCERIGPIGDGRGGLRFPYPDEEIPFWLCDDVALFYGNWIRDVVLSQERREE